MTDGSCWAGKILWVDLTTESIREEHLSTAVYRNFIGGKGLGTYLLCHNLPAGIDPLSERNLMVFMSGPLQCLPGPSVGRWSLITKSPLTGLYLDTHCGGPLGREIKRCGYDGVCVTGRADVPSILSLNDDEARIDDASVIWGRGVMESTRRLHEHYGSGAAVYVIGPAGERGVQFATGTCEFAHQTGRGGAGAVMGSKNLKGIVARGHLSYTPADPEQMRTVSRELTSTWATHTTGFKDLGTGILVELSNELGQFPYRNWSSGYCPDHSGLDVYAAYQKYGRGDHLSCPHCIMRCTHSYVTSDPDNPGREVESTVEYETLGMMGGNLGITDFQSVLRLNYLCDDLGMDTISTGTVIGFVMDILESGIFTESELGVSVRFGDADGAEHMVRLIAKREGIGDVLSKGVRHAAETLGRGSDRLAVHVKGLECAAWDPRGRRCMGLSYATADVGASHLRGWPATTEPPDASAVSLVESMTRSRDEKTLRDSLIICHFTYRLPISLDQEIRLLTAATGLDFKEADIWEFGNRVETLTRLFNVREGISRRDDSLPARLWEPQADGPRKGMSSFVDRADFESSLEKYYALRGWDTNGIPLPVTVQRLGLTDVFTDVL